MFKIRKGVFETNSSSTHSICVTKENEVKLDIPNKIEIDLSEYEFGWEHRIVSSTEEKLAYLLLGMCGYKEMTKAMNNLHILLDLLKDKIEIIGIKGIEFRNYKKEEIYCSIDGGYVDHGDELQEFIDELLLNKELLYNFLFSSNSFIITGNDNSGMRINIKVDYPHYEYFKGN